MVVSDNQAHADSIAAAATRSALQDDASFQKWTGAVGDPGVVTMYASPQAPEALMKAEQKEMRYSLGPSSGSSSTQMLGPEAGMNKVWKAYRDKYKHFQGAAGVLRFHDGAIEAEFVGQSAPKGTNAPAADLSDLPASTAAAFGVGIKHGWLHGYTKQLAPLVGGEADLRRMIAMANRQTGLSLPGDLAKLLGDGVTLSLDSSADLQALSQNPDPSTVPVGLRIKGDPASITGVVDKIKAALGPQAPSLVTKSGDGVVAVGLDKQYVDSLAGHGTLGSDPTFTSVVPHADQSSAAFYVNFDAGNGWMRHLADTLSHGDPSVKANVAPLKAFGISGWADGGVTHGLVRLTTN
jgi:hypothetical protein